MEKINVLRSEIDLIDQKIIDLLNKRFTICKEVGIIKKENEINVLDKNRENNILDELNKNSIYSISPIYQEIFKISKNQQL